MATLGFKDNDNLDIGNKYLTKEYLIDRYPNVALHSNMPSMWTWGQGPSGELGDNTATTSRSTPGTVFAGATNWKTVDAFTHVLAVKQDGTLWTWGGASYGALGSGATTSRSSPQTTAGTAATTWVKVSAGRFYSMAMQNNGTAWTWGRNNKGQLGDGSTTNRSSPQTTAGGTADTWQQIACGYEHSLGIKTDGVLYSWGSNLSGALGTGNTTSRSSPVSVPTGLTNWNFISAGTSFSTGITNDGRLWTWGLNTNGQLGDGTTSPRSSPQTTAGGGTNWKLVSAGTAHVAAVKTDGSFWAWGLNSNGQVGDGSTQNKSSPVTVSGGGLNWVRVHSGGTGTAGIKADGSLWVWGANVGGDVGDGTTTQRLSPVQTALPVYSWKLACLGAFGFAAAIKEEDDY